jgi:predicted AAA+ superfamily ATPase
MLTQNDIAQVIAGQRGQAARRGMGLSRDILPVLPDLTSHALIISGIRRCGKSTLLEQLLASRGADALALNFDDPRLAGFEPADFQLLDTLIAKGGARSLFFDEIQVVQGWESYIRQKLDEGFRIAITGSNASLLSRELGTRLTGRHVTRELFPFSYNEFLRFRALTPGEESLRLYLDEGGFPEYLKSKEPDILSNLLYDILYRDIAVRYGIRNTRGLKQFAVYLFSNPGNLITANKFRQLLGIKTTATVLEYFSHLEDAYLTAFMPRFSHSARVRSVNPKKIYVADPGLVKVASLSFSDDRGRMLENAVYWQLRRQGMEPFYFNEKNAECNFVTMRSGNKPLLMQVCHELTPANRQREQRGLSAAMDFFQAEEGLIITFAQRDTYLDKGRRIQVVPAWEFFTSS